MRAIMLVAVVTLAAGGCATAPTTAVVLENSYTPSLTSPLVIYDAFWEAVSFQVDGGIPPGASSAPQSTVACSASTAYVVLAPGWDPTSQAAPASLVVLESRGAGFGVSLGGTLDIPVNDTTFVGNCAAGSFLSEEEAQFITQEVFPNDFANLRYDPATCAVTPLGDGGATDAGDSAVP